MLCKAWSYFLCSTRFHSMHIKTYICFIFAIQDSLLDKLDDVQLEPPSCPEEQCILCAVNKATMQTFPCAQYRSV